MDVHADEGTTPIDHQPDCEVATHTDPAMDCATPTVDTHGLITHIAYGSTGARAYAELRTMAPLALTAAGALEIAARFAALGQHLLGL